MDTIIKNYPAPQVNEYEVLRYAGMKGEGTAGAEAVKELLAEVIEEAAPVLEYKICYKKLPIPEYLLNHPAMSCCERGILFAATVGAGIDELVNKYKDSDPAKALLFDALGSERVESLCDIFCNEMGLKIRISPGYGSY